MRLLVLLLSFILSVHGECPHQDFIQQHVCDTCRGWKEVLQHQIAAGATGITAVLGPAVDDFPPLFRQNGPYHNDLCINRAARPAYRCNMDAKKKYCFKVSNKCYGAHSPQTGQFYKVLRMALIECVDDYTWERQHAHDDFNDTNRRLDTRYDK
eukprot:TRINITY_DN7279_c0_g1_i3.p1 TRINITY_DN7279_c0_g1~~TRINITY_DN7279_c0_g1_i3.p1  ORF type:complete len:175 (-),score=57.41 TRINITY_DN7279_c0_g1_i3:145-606(-)